MKKYVLTLALLLCLFLSVLVFSSCGKRGKTTGTTATPETAQTVPGGSATDAATEDGGLLVFTAPAGTVTLTPQ